MGEVQAGNWLLDERSQPCWVTATSPVMEGHDCYQLTFSDGATIVADAEHSWQTETSSPSGPHAVKKIQTTREIATTLTYGKEAGHFIVDSVRERRFIVNVQSVPSEPVRCVSVSSPSRLYLAGETFIPTHNSDLLLGLAIMAHKRSIVFRREYPQLKALIDRSYEILRGTGAKFNSQSNVWRNVPGDRIIEFGAVQYERDVERYQGRPHDLVAFDEIAHFTQTQYEYLLGWNRTTDPDQRNRVVAAGNPPLYADGEWIIRYWGPWLNDQHPNPALPEELRWFARVEGEEREVESGEPFEHKGEHIAPKSRTFVPASVEDNPYLLETGYRARLQALPEPMRSKLLYGDFGIQFEDDPWQLIPTQWVLEAQKRWEEQEKPEMPLSAMGVDVARGGHDSTVIAKRYGTWFAPLIKLPGRETANGQSVAALVINQMEPRMATPPAVDVIGVGAAAYDILQSQGVLCTPVNFSERSEETDQSGQLSFINKRAEYYWLFREMLDPANKVPVALPPDLELRTELCATRWSMSARGIKIESKEEIKSRIQRSPDCADAIVLAAGFSMRLPLILPNRAFMSTPRGRAQQPMKQTLSGLAVPSNLGLLITRRKKR